MLSRKDHKETCRYPMRGFIGEKTSPGWCSACSRIQWWMSGTVLTKRAQREEWKRSVGGPKHHERYEEKKACLEIQIVKENFVNEFDFCHDFYLWKNDIYYCMQQSCQKMVWMREQASASMVWLWNVEGCNCSVMYWNQQSTLSPGLFRCTCTILVNFHW